MNEQEWHHFDDMVLGYTVSVLSIHTERGPEIHTLRVTPNTEETQRLGVTSTAIKKIKMSKIRKVIYRSFR